MARSRKWKNKPEEVRAAGREAKLNRQLERIAARIAPGDFVYTLCAQGRALRLIETRLGIGRN